MSEFVKNHVMPKELAINRGYRLLTLIKNIFKSVIVFLDGIVNQVGSQHELITSVSNKSRKVREYVSVVYECVCSVKRSEKLRNHRRTSRGARGAVAPPVTEIFEFFRAKVLGRKYSKRLSKPDLKATFSVSICQDGV